MQNHNPFKIYNASAGSGKTFKLAANYLSLLLENTNVFAFQHILAITFTNKAVGEMKSRIIEHLIGFSKDEIHKDFLPLLEAIRVKTGLSKEQINQQSKDILPYLLNNYAGVEISTIDSFTHRLIRTFAKDLGLSTNFEIELESQEVVEEAVHRLVNQAGEENLLTKVLIDFALEKINEDKSGDITMDLLEISKLLNNENNLPYIEGLASLSLASFEEIKNSLRKNIKRLENEICITAEAFFELLAPHAIDANSFTRGSVYIFFNKVKKIELPDKWDALWMKNIATEPLYPKKATAAIKAALDKHQPTIALFYEKIKKNNFELKYQKEISKYLTQTSVLWLIQHELEGLKTERNLLFINDFNKKISEQIRQQPAPFIYERLGEKFHQYFIDEFQDTSQMQWKNLIPLIENALAGELKNGKTGELSLVGDAKQSIYAWRGGDAQQFIDLYEGNSPFPIDAKAVGLQTNYRSETHIVEFNNWFFSFVASQLEDPTYQKLYQNAAQEIFKNMGKGFVQIDFFEANNLEASTQAYTKKVLEIIQTKVQNKEANYSDFCVLVRKKSQGVAIANHLSENGIPLISSETLLIANSPKVRWLVHLLNAFNDSSNLESWYEVYTFLVNRLTINAQEKHILLSKLLLQTPQSSLTQLGYHLDTEKLLSLPLYDAVIYLQKQVEFLQEENAYIQFFLEEVFQFSKKKNNNVASFLSYWHIAKNKRSIVSPEGQNAVQVVTIHKSKGLQFPIVIFPFADNEIGSLKMDKLWLPTNLPHLPFALASGKSNFFTEVSPEVAATYQSIKNKKILEDINLLYVTLTRAEKEMFILSKYSINKAGVAVDKDSVASLLKDFLEHKGLWQTEKYHYVFGEPLKHKLLECINPEESSPIKLRKEDALDMLTSKSYLWAQDKHDAIERGNTIHQLLAKIYSQKDVDTVVERAFVKGEISAEENKEYKRLLHSICTQPEINSYFVEGIEVWNEKEILHQGKLLRPDRVVLINKKAVILDYKTGEASARFLQQIQEYAQAIEELGYHVEKKIIVYIRENEISIVNL